MTPDDIAPAQDRRTVTAVLPDLEHAHLALSILTSEGVDRERLSVLATRSDDSDDLPQPGSSSGAALAGATIGGGAGAALLGSLVAAGTFVAPGLGVMAAGPWLAALAGAGAGGAAGGALGGLFGATVTDAHRSDYEEDLRAGRVLIGFEGDPHEVDHVRSVLERTDAAQIREF